MSGIVAKVDRAGEHVDALYAEIRHWAEGRPYTLLSEPEGPSQQHRIYLHFRDVPPNTQHWGLLLGDAVHNLRSALDHLVYALAVRESGQDPPLAARHLGFPITTAAEEWRGQKHTKTRGLSPEMRALVKSVQPFSSVGGDPDADLLAILSRLDIADKHRTAVPVAVLPHGFQGYVRTITEGPVTFTFLPADLKENSTVLSITGEAVTEVEEDPASLLAIALDVGLQAPVEIATLMDQLFARVVHVLTQFHRFF